MPLECKNRRASSICLPYIANSFSGKGDRPFGLPYLAKNGLSGLALQSISFKLPCLFNLKWNNLFIILNIIINVYYNYLLITNDPLSLEAINSIGWINGCCTELKFLNTLCISFSSMYLSGPYSVQLKIKSSFGCSLSLSIDVDVETFAKLCLLCDCELEGRVNSYRKNINITGSLLTLISLNALCSIGLVIVYYSKISEPLWNNVSEDASQWNLMIDQLYKYHQFSSTLLNTAAPSHGTELYKNPDPRIFWLLTMMLVLDSLELCL